jgi:hypothetical protein
MTPIKFLLASLLSAVSAAADISLVFRNRRLGRARRIRRREKENTTARPCCLVDKPVDPRPASTACMMHRTKHSYYALAHIMARVVNNVSKQGAHATESFGEAASGTAQPHK